MASVCSFIKKGVFYHQDIKIILKLIQHTSKPIEVVY